jgi:hypothetical protein
VINNLTQVMIVDSADYRGYIYTPSTTTFAQITHVDWPTASQAVYQDGYFIVMKPDTDEFYISANEDGTTWDAADFIRAEGSPDLGVALVSEKRELWYFQEATTEIFYNSGDATFPFERIQGAYMNMGCAAAFSVASLDNSLFWLGRDKRGRNIVLRASGYTPQRISTHPLEYQIESYSDVSDAFAYAYQQEGHTFYVLTFPTGNATWVYDASTGLWHERQSFDGLTDRRHLANCYSFCFNKHLVGSWQDGNLYELDLDTYDDNGQMIKRIRAGQHMHNDRKRVFYHKFELDMEFGVGLDGGAQGEDPQAMLRFSDDGGHTWSNEKWASFGKIGERKKRVFWRKLGQSRDRIFEVKITDPVKVVIVDANVDVTPSEN